MTRLPSFSCYLVGEGTLPLQCAEMLWAAGHSILGILTDDEALQQWAAEHAIPTTRMQRAGLLPFVQQQPFDYLFSIVNPVILPLELLRLPRRMAINYHDAPLPRYAGTYATSWAILRGESLHGITWHEMVETVDAGDILAQHMVPISADETALTLNAKCYDAALDAFETLIAGLADGSLRPRPQDLSRRTYVGPWERPFAAALLSWQQDPLQLSALVRALDHGPYPNRLALPKLWLGDRFVVVRELTVHAASSAAAPGTVLDLAADCIRVSAGYADVCLSDFATLTGQPLSVAELITQYGLNVGAHLPELPEAPAQQLHLLTETIAPHESFWRRRLETLQPASLPWLAQTGARHGAAGYATWTLPVPADAAGGLSGVTLPELLLTLVAVYVARLSQSDTLDLGLQAPAVAPELAPLIAAAVPLRLQLDPAWSVLETIDYVRQQLAVAARRQTYSRDLIARYPSLRDRPHLSAGAQFPIAVARPPEGVNGRSLPVQPPPGTRLMFGFTPAALACTYDTAALEAGTMQRIGDQLEALLAAMLAAPHAPISRLNVLPAAERAQLLTSWQGAPLPHETDPLPAAQVAAQAQRQPDAPAVVVYKAETAVLALTYRELNQAANWVARQLQQRGVGPETRVGILAGRSAEMIVAQLGVLKAGGAFVPIDPGYPPDRVAFMIADGLDPHTPIVITPPEHAALLPYGLTPLLLDLSAGRRPAAEEPAAEGPARAPAPDQLAYVIYTSGTTGRPKGVQIAQRGLRHLIAWHRRRLDIGPADRITQAVTPSFDGALVEIWPALALGASLHIPDEPTRSSPWEFRSWCVAHQLTVAVLPTPLGEALFPLHWPRATRLRLLVVGGDKLHQHPPASLPFRVVNEYGPTENCVISTYHVVPPAAGAPAAPAIGRPMENVHALVLDAHQNMLPIGAPGELYVGGPGLARGYLNRPGLTAERFVAWRDESGLLAGDVLPQIATLPLYRTGDLVMWQPDGALQFLGRLDNQVKVRGFRIELNEIEAQLRQHRLVRQCVVVARQEEGGPQQLVAYVVTRLRATAASVLIREWRHFLEERLPAYMLPSTFVLLNQLPLTANGKVDRQALPAPESLLPAFDQPYDPPRTMQEEAIARAWAAALGVPRVGIHHDFFALGGNSLLATQLTARLRQALGVDLALGDLFESATVARLAERVAELQQAAQLAVPLQVVPRGARVPASSMQRRLWFLAQLQPDDPTYNMSVALQLDGLLETSFLEAVLQQIVARHESLRTHLEAVDGQPTQVVASESTVPLQLVDLTGQPAAAQQAAVAAEAKRPFDLSQPPLCRFVLFQFSQTRYVLLLTLHHSITDGWSMVLLLKELSHGYTSRLRGDPPEWPPLPVQYVDFAAWQQQWLDSHLAARQLTYWRERLAGDLPRLDLPTDLPRPRAQTFRGGSVRFTLPAALARDVESASRAAGVTRYMLLLAAFKLLLFRYTGQSDVCVGTPVASRQRPELANLIGFFVNTLVLRTDLGGGITGQELLSRVRETTLGAFANQETPFETLVQLLRPERDPGQQPLFQVMFDLLEEGMLPAVSLPHVEARSLPVDTGTAKFDLVLSIQAHAGGLDGTLTYNSDLFVPETARRLAAHYLQLLRGLLQDPTRPVARLPLLTEGELAQIGRAWQGTAVAYPDTLLPALFAAQAARNPNAIAAIAADDTMPGPRQLTYAELARRASQLAHALQAAGVRPETIVAVYLTRSLDTLVALLGILQAGGAYLPLNPDYPPERLQFMLRDAAAPLVLTRTALASRLPETPARVICLDGDAGLPPAPAAPPRVPITATQLAYVIYTSGSTGQPKGVQITHGAIAPHCLDMQRTYALTPADRVLQFSAHSFDASLEQILPTLISGAAVVMRGDEVWSPAELDARLAQFGVTVANLPTAYWGALAQAWAGGGALHCAATLRLVIAGGESMPVRLLDIWRRTPLPGVRLLNAYGPTETTITATLCETAALDTAALAQPGVPIGRPLSNRLALILDAHDQPVPVGVTGELVLGGAGVARGYLKRPELTAARFAPIGLLTSGFGDVLTSPIVRPTFYRTGDLACWRADGTIQMLGRLDDQVKIRGFRIELGEIEATLARHPAVAEAVVQVRESAAGERQLIGFAARRGEVTAAALRRFLGESLPPHMVPAHLLLLDALPVTPNGKIDRRALAAWPLPDVAVETADPSTPLEAELAVIFAEVLGRERVGVQESFFDAGGHSLQAVQLVAQVVQRLGQTISVRDVFLAPTVADLAARLTAGQPNGGRAGPAAAVPASAGAQGLAPTGDIRIVQEPLAPRLLRGELPPLDGVALGYLGDRESPFEQALYAACGGRPLLAGITETAWGRLGLMLLPRFLPALYADPAGTLADIDAALALSARLGARTVSLTGLIPSATGYGRAIQAAAVPRSPKRPQISTGHAVTTTAVVLTIERVLAESGRQLPDERVGFLGLGSIGAASLRLMLSVLPHPAELLLCDLYSKQAALEALRAELVEQFGYRGRIRLITSSADVPAPFYAATLIVGATNVPDVLAVPALQPGTLLVDDSGPHCFDVAAAIRRFQDQGDILFTEGGVLQLPRPARRWRYLPPAAAIAPDRAQQKMFIVDERQEIMGCAFSSVLSSRYEALRPTIGEIDLAACLPHYSKLVGLGFRGGSLRCGGFRPTETAVRQFRYRFAAPDVRQTNSTRRA